MFFLKSFLILFLFITFVCFCFCLVCGAVCAVIEIIRDPSRFKVVNSSDQVPEDFLSSGSEVVSSETSSDPFVEEKKIIIG